MKSIDTSHMQTQFNPQSKSKVARKSAIHTGQAGHTKLAGQKKELVDTGEKSDISSAALLASQRTEEETPAEESSSGTRTEKHRERLAENYGEPKSSESVKEHTGQSVKRNDSGKMENLESNYGAVNLNDEQKAVILQKVLGLPPEDIKALIQATKGQASSETDTRHKKDENNIGAGILSTLHEQEPVSSNTSQATYQNRLLTDQEVLDLNSKFKMGLTAPCHIYEDDKGVSILVDNMAQPTTSQIPEGSLFDGGEHKIVSITKEDNGFHSVYSYNSSPVDGDCVSITGGGGPVGPYWMGKIERSKGEEIGDVYKTIIYPPPDENGFTKIWYINDTAIGNDVTSTVEVYSKQVAMPSHHNPYGKEDEPWNPWWPQPPAPPPPPPGPPPPLGKDGVEWMENFLKERSSWRNGYIFGFGEGTLPTHAPFNNLPTDEQWQKAYGVGQGDGKSAMSVYPHVGAPDYPVYVPKPVPMPQQIPNYGQNQGGVIQPPPFQDKPRKSFLSSPPEGSTPAIPTAELMKTLGKNDKIYAFKTKDGNIFHDIERGDGTRNQVIYDKSGNLLSGVTVDKEGNEAKTTFMDDGTSKVETTDGSVMIFKGEQLVDKYQENPQEPDVKESFWHDIPSGARQITADPMIAGNLKPADTINTYELPNGDKLSEVYTAGDGKRHQITSDKNGNKKQLVSEDLRTGEQIKSDYNSDGTVNSYSSNGSSMFVDKQGNVAMAGTNGRSVTGNNYETGQQGQPVNQQIPPYMRSGSAYVSDKSLNYTPFRSDYNNLLAGGPAPDYTSNGYTYATHYNPSINTPLFSTNGMSPAAYTLGSYLNAGMMGMGYGMGYPMMGGYGMGMGLGMGMGMGYGMGLGMGGYGMGMGYGMGLGMGGYGMGMGYGMGLGMGGYGMGMGMMGMGMGYGMGLGMGGYGMGMMGMGLGMGALTMGAGMLGTAIGYNLF